MFSSLLSKPKNSEYHKPISLKRKTDKSNHKVLILPGVQPDFKSQQSSAQQSSVTTTSDQPDSLTDTSKKYHLNPDGSLNYSLSVLSQNAGDRKFHTSYEDTIPLKKRYPNLKHFFPKYDLQTCPDDSLRTCIDDTKNVINKLLQEKLGEVAKQDSSTVNYTAHNVVNDRQDERGRTTQIQIKEYQQDPMLPPKHKLRKNRPTDPSPPPPILKKTKPEKLSKEQQDEWKIPSVVSNWKNNQGFTISLDKRMLAATSNETPEVNLNKLSDLSSALESADKQAREDIKVRNEIRQQAIEKQQMEKEKKLQELAELTRKQNQSKRKHDNENYYNQKRNRH